MAIRYGGRYELEGSMEVLGLPADGVESARRSTHFCARSWKRRESKERPTRARLAAVWTGNEDVVTVSTFPPPSTRIRPRADRYGAITRLAGGVAAALRAMLSPVGREVAERLRAALSPRKSSPDLEMVARAGLDERLEDIRRKLLVVQDFIAELAAVGENDGAEPARVVDLGAILRTEVRLLDARAARMGVEVRTIRSGLPDPRRRSNRACHRAPWPRSFARLSRTAWPPRVAVGTVVVGLAATRGRSSARESSSTTPAPSFPLERDERCSRSRSRAGHLRGDRAASRSSSRQRSRRRWAGCLEVSDAPSAERVCA